MKVTLTILKEDIEEGNYINGFKCPITKALARAGYPNLQDKGTAIIDEVGNIVCSRDNCPEYNEMANRVIWMDGYVRGHRSKSFFPPETFTVTIDIMDASDMKEEAHTNIQDFT